MGFQLGQLQVAQAGQGVLQQLRVAVEGLGAHPALAGPALPVLGQGRGATAEEGEAAALERVQGADQLGSRLLLGGAVEGASHPLAGLGSTMV